MADDRIRVALIEDQKRTREGLSALIGGSPGMAVVGEYASGDKALAEIEFVQPNVILTDLNVPGLSGVELVKSIHALLPDVPILILTVYGEDENVFGALCHGAIGYLLKDIEPVRLLAAIRESHTGGSPMSPEIARRAVLKLRGWKPANESNPMSEREMQVLHLLVQGHSYKTCATQLSVSVDTIRFHIRSIYNHLHVHSKSEAVGKALRNGWIK